MRNKDFNKIFSSQLKKILGYSGDDLTPFGDVLEMQKCYHFSNPLRFYRTTSTLEIQKYLIELLSCRFKFLYHIYSLSSRLDHWVSVSSLCCFENQTFFIKIRSLWDQGGSIAERRACLRTECRVVSLPLSEELFLVIEK